MENSKRLMHSNEVISVDRQDNVLMSHNTYKVEEFLHELGDRIGERNIKKWIDEEVPCEVLTPNQGWKKGKVKISLEFYPDEVESPLEDIRQDMNK
ncbi:MAG: KGK domain-containing protein [Xenococcaceae cyanobacterium MO_188.B32]|nr:KGK domain-containing protein [Xenococcaceae cyanobacterium MO_188.B32]